MLFEARRAVRNERAQLARGGIEPRGDVYTVMRIAYPASFAAMLVEMSVRGHPSTAFMLSGATLFGAAKALKWWAIATLGPATGPLRYSEHVIGSGRKFFAEACRKGLEGIVSKRRDAS